MKGLLSIWMFVFVFLMGSVLAGEIDVEIVSPLDGSTLSSVVVLEVVTDVRAVCNYGLGYGMSLSPPSCENGEGCSGGVGGGGGSRSVEMNKTGGIFHSQEIGWLQDTINNESRKEWRTVYVSCLNREGNGSARSVFYIERKYFEVLQKGNDSVQVIITSDREANGVGFNEELVLFNLDGVDDDYEEFGEYLNERNIEGLVVLGDFEEDDFISAFTDIRRKFNVSVMIRMDGMSEYVNLSEFMITEDIENYWYKYSRSDGDFVSRDGDFPETWDAFSYYNYLGNERLNYSVKYLYGQDTGWNSDMAFVSLFGERVYVSSPWDFGERPVVELFVMSYCPYGTQLEKGILPVVKFFGDKIDFRVKFVYYAMHPSAGEVEEQLNQYCIQEEFNDRYIDYLECFLNDGNGSRCLGVVGISENDLNDCVNRTDEEFNVFNNLNDTSSWLNGRFPKFDIHKEDNEKYDIEGSPTLVINGEKIQVGRDSVSLVNAIYSAFDVSFNYDDWQGLFLNTEYAPGFEDYNIPEIVQSISDESVVAWTFNGSVVSVEYGNGGEIPYDLIEAYLAKYPSDLFKFEEEFLILENIGNYSFVDFDKDDANEEWWSEAAMDYAEGEAHFGYYGDGTNDLIVIIGRSDSYLLDVFGIANVFDKVQRGKYKLYNVSSLGDGLIFWISGDYIVGFHEEEDSWEVIDAYLVKFPSDMVVAEEVKKKISGGGGGGSGVSFSVINLSADIVNDSEVIVLDNLETVGKDSEGVFSSVNDSGEPDEEKEFFSVITGAVSGVGDGVNYLGELLGRMIGWFRGLFD